MSYGAIADFWRGLYRHGATGLTDELIARFEPELSPAGRAALRAFAEQARHDHKWIEDQRAYMRDEAERIGVIGETMRRAGLRSYTDKEGRIFVADDRSKP